MWSELDHASPNTLRYLCFKYKISQTAYLASAVFQPSLSLILEFLNLEIRNELRISFNPKQYSYYRIKIN